MSQTILIVDDEPQLVRAIDTNLTARSYRTFSATNGIDALTMVGDKNPDLVILDLGLPGLSGYEVISRLRTWTQVPIIVISARTDESDKIEALDAGADDFVTKPFSIGELMARVRANLRRSDREVVNPTCHTSDFTLDFALGEARRGSEVVHLTPTEWKIVGVLVGAEGKLVTQRALLAAVWGPMYTEETNYLRVHLAHIRRKLEPTSSRPKYFRTEPGIGYRFVNTQD